MDVSDYMPKITSYWKYAGKNSDIFRIGLNSDASAICQKKIVVFGNTLKKLFLKILICNLAVVLIVQIVRNKSLLKFFQK
jgi:hypothetical protein